MNSLQGASYAGLAFTSWEVLITLPEEADYIWIYPLRLTLIKSLYLFCRYFALLVQIANTMFARLLEARYPVPSSTCKLWLMYQAFVTYSLLGAVDIILMIRVYAFYNRNRRIGIILLLLLLCRVVLSGLSAAMTIPDQQFNSACLSNKMPGVVLYCFAIGEITLQTALLVMTFGKQICATSQGWARTPLVSLLCRDGSTVYTITCSVLVGTILYARFGYHHETAHFVFPLVFLFTFPETKFRILLGPWFLSCLALAAV
ncbi:hypothetical protein BDQ12DRAFT_673655 [Crucibulum laeve]|uniref:DUF6533 domain-containing protein n=1 Tax=Crucibulum laeve TaxID=68775 RepID=A0A5C3MKD3_9AGAR|nr:hypothetical protein BDQ12DRAFT_673655 [Crucibulum laeve]